MIETFFGLDGLSSAQASLAALGIGFLFGLALERAGFGSSRRLAGIFYFKDMAVLKVMFTALITAMLGLSYCLAFGWLRPESLYFMPTVFGAQIVGGFLFGIGFVMSGWCPGTGAVGLASGRLDALVFLAGAGLGSILFNELYPVVKPLYVWGSSGIRFAYQSLGTSPMLFAMLFTLIAVMCFWGAEYLEKIRMGTGNYWNSPFLKAFSLLLVVLAGGQLLFPGAPQTAAAPQRNLSAAADLRDRPDNRLTSLLGAVESGKDHIGSTELADRLMAGDPSLLVVDVRRKQEFMRFHIRGAVHAPLSKLTEFLRPYRNRGIVVLYSNGMTHPAQARNLLVLQGYRNVYFLTDGLKGFIETCLKPASLRSEPLPPGYAERVTGWRRFFLSQEEDADIKSVGAIELPRSPLPGLVKTQWLAANLGKTGLKLIDLRRQPEYNTSHIPGSFCLSVESLRGVVSGVPAMLLPSPMLAMQMAQMGIEPGDMVVLVPGDKVRDATLAAMALERLRHSRYAILDGGFDKWIAENRPVDTKLPDAPVSRFPANNEKDDFTVDYHTVLRLLQADSAIVLDVRPTDYYLGKKTDEARAGHIPGALNRPFSEDVFKEGASTRLKSVPELAAAYGALLPTKQATVIVHCRTGHQASQTFFVLKHLLGYQRVLWYDAGWTEWASRAELPVATGTAD